MSSYSPTKDTQAPGEASSPTEDSLNMKFPHFFLFIGDISDSKRWLQVSLYLCYYACKKTVLNLGRKKWHLPARNHNFRPSYEKTFFETYFWQRIGDNESKYFSYEIKLTFVLGFTSAAEWQQCGSCGQLEQLLAGSPHENSIIK